MIYEFESTVKEPKSDNLRGFKREMSGLLTLWEIYGYMIL